MRSLATEAAAADSPGTLPRARSVIEYRASTKREKYPTRASRPRPALKALLDSLRSIARLRNSRRRPPRASSPRSPASVNLRKCTAPATSLGCCASRSRLSFPPGTTQTTAWPLHPEAAGPHVGFDIHRVELVSTGRADNGLEALEQARCGFYAGVLRFHAMFRGSAWVGRPLSHPGS